MGLILKDETRLLIEGTPLVEMGPMSDIYTDGIGKIEVLGPNVRLWWFTYQGEPRERVVVARIVRPIESLQDGLVKKWIRESHTNIGLQ